MRVAAVRFAYICLLVPPLAAADKGGDADSVHVQRIVSLRTHAWDHVAKAQQGGLRLRQRGHADESTSSLLV